MMKKIILVISIIIVLLSFNKIDLVANIIPNEAIRLRILSNSNLIYDQHIKEKVQQKVQCDISSLLGDVNNIDVARKVIKNNINQLDNNIGNLLKEENYNLEYKVNFGYHYFPKKTYKGITYKEGNYESLLVTLGKGEGSNWWCVLFPPLCLIEAEESTDIEYQFFVKEIINKIFK